MDAGLQLDEGPVVLQPDDLADQPLADLVALLDRGPRVGVELLQPERDVARLRIDGEHHRLDGVAHGE